MNEIKAGDLVMVMRHCCDGDKYGGHIGVVSYIYVGAGRCPQCQTDHLGAPSAHVDGIQRAGFRTSWLKRIPPLGELDDVKKGEEITA